MHYQSKPFEQGKLLTVLRGSIVDYIWKLEKNSKNKVNIKKFFLSGRDNKWLWVPPDYAHGYLTCEDNTLILYKVSKYYSCKYEKTINIFKDGVYKLMKIKKSKIITSKKDSRIF